MKRGLVVTMAAPALAALAAGCALWYFSLPEGRLPRSPQEIAASERSATIAALRPKRKGRPVIAIVGINDATETTDYLMTYGILKRADVAAIATLAVSPGAVRLYPALTVVPDASVAQFDASHPEGADYVVVPAMSRDDDPIVGRWLRAQAAKGALVIGVCAGAKVVAAAGLLDGKRATTHWYYRKRLFGDHPTARYVPNRRFVIDGQVATSTGISASMPFMLSLIEAIGGASKAQEVAADLGVHDWGPRHDSGAFQLSRPFVRTVLGNSAALWKHETLGLRPESGVDEVSLALVADAWSRTYRSKVRTLGARGRAIRSKHGIWLLPDAPQNARDDRRLAALAGLRPQQALNATLDDIRRRYGESTKRIVAMQLEYPAL